MLKRSRLIIGAAIPAVMLGIMVGWRALRTPAPERVQVPLRDGASLPTTIYRPRGEGPWPVILFRSPSELPVDPWPFSRRGYVVAVQVARRTAGDPRPMTDREDGYDTIEWLAAQPFSSGRVGVAGHAEVGYLAYLAASASPPHLASAFVSHAPASLFKEGHRLGGAFRAADTVMAMRAAGLGAEAAQAHRLRSKWDEGWSAADFETHASGVAVPVYHATAWYDPGVRGVLRAASTLQEQGLPGARGRQRILVRPAVRGEAAGDLSFPRAEVDEDLFWWFDRTLKKDQTTPTGVRYYLSGPARAGFRGKESGYRETEVWPPAGATSVRWRLGAGGALRRGPSASETESTSWSRDIVPSLGGRNAAIAGGPADLSLLDEHAGVARFASEPLSEPMVFAGNAYADLVVSRPSGDVVVKLADVYPDGYAAWIAGGALRPRSVPDEAEQDPSRPTRRLRVDLGPLAVVVGKGHRIAVYLASTSRPALDPDPEPGAVAASPTVWHSDQRPSAIVLPSLAQAPPVLDRSE